MQHFLSAIISSADKVGKTIFYYGKVFMNFFSSDFLIRFWFEICVRFQLGFPGNTLWVQFIAG
jgi:hypothetical protein